MTKISLDLLLLGESIWRMKETLTIRLLSIALKLDMVFMLT